MKNSVRTIDIVEKRLSESCGLVEEGWNEGTLKKTEPLSVRGMIMYWTLRGDNYFKLLKDRMQKEREGKCTTANSKLLGKRENSKVDEELRGRCRESYDKSVDLAIKSLDPFDPMRLLAVSSSCKFLVQFENKSKTAANLASEAFHAANSHIHANKPALTGQLLQILRDKYMSNEHLQDEDNESENNEDTKLHDEFEGVDDMRKKSTHDEVESIKLIPNTKRTTYTSSFPDVNITASSTKFLENIKRKVHLGEPVEFEGIQSWKECLVALERIFRAFVRGNSLAGNIESGSVVSLGGVPINTATFLLQGPYMSWNGFLLLLRDFNIASPLENSEMGKANIKHTRQNTSGSAAYGDAPLKIQEAACIFIESSQTGNPVITSRKHAVMYKKIKNELNGKEDPYEKVARWLDQENWVINVGLNFAQFCDCLAKCGTLAYSNKIFSEALPTVQEKIEHFFSAHLGLLDDELCRKRIEFRNKAAQTVQLLGK